MALTVEDGTGKPNSDSYISIADATAYFADRGQGDAWDALPDQEAALRLATQYLEQMYRMAWKGYRVGTVQALSWPRSYVIIPDLPYGYGAGVAYLPPTTIPVEVRNACAELALRTASGVLAPDLTRGILSEKMGPMETTYDKSSPQQTRYRAVDAMLSPYLRSSGAMMTLRRS